jgi:hypothetical protein
LQVHAAKDIEHSVKHAFPSPIYQSGADRFEIVNCAPQLKAMREGKIGLHALSKGHCPGKRMNSNILPGLSKIGFWNSRRQRGTGDRVSRNRRHGLRSGRADARAAGRPSGPHPPVALGHVHFATTKLFLSPQVSYTFTRKSRRLHSIPAAARVRLNQRTKTR